MKKFTDFWGEYLVRPCMMVLQLSLSLLVSF